MSSPYRRDVTISFGGPLTPAVKNIIIANLVVFVLQVLYQPLGAWMALVPPRVLPMGFELWRVFTYMFVHGSTMHILFNMLFLFFLGCQLERHWGTRFFTQYYILCGVGAGLFAFIPIDAFFYASHIGASGAIYGVLLAYGILFPRNSILFMLMFPIEARYFVFIMGFFAFWGSLSATGDGVSHIAHLGGLVVGYAIMRWAGLKRRAGIVPSSSLGGFGPSRSTKAGSGGWGGIKDYYRRWRMKRLKKKFESYYEKRTKSGNDPNTIH